MLAGMPISKTSAGNVRLTFVGASGPLNAFQRKNAGIDICRMFREMENHPDGMVTISCDWGGQTMESDPSPRLFARVDATFYYRCNASGECPFEDFGGPEQYLHLIFSKGSNRYEIRETLKESFPEKFSEVTAMWRRDIGNAEVHECATTTEQAPCYEIDGCRWRYHSEFCVPEYLGGY